MTSETAAKILDEMQDITALADAVTDLGRMSAEFSLIKRTACYHADRRTRESDGDHTVMLCLVAPALADLLYPRYLDPGLVSQFASVHDLCEVYAGDTPTLRITASGRQAKAGREHQAALRIYGQFDGRLPWVGRMLRRYEEQQEPEARFTRLVDKDLPKIVHAIDGCTGLIEYGMTVSELRALYARQATEMAAYGAEFGKVLKLHAELAGRAVALLSQKERASA